MSRKHASKAGISLVELLLAIGLMAAVSLTVLPLFFSTTENRLFQQTAATVEQNGTQMLQNIALRVRQSERILSPGVGGSGQVLILQTASGGTNPFIIGVSSGILILVKHATRQEVSSPQVAVQNFRVRNTSVSALRQSVALSFTVSRTIRLQQPHSYLQGFEASFTLPPDDVVLGDGCTCTGPVCQNNTYTWKLCEQGACVTAATPLDCP